MTAPVSLTALVASIPPQMNDAIIGAAGGTAAIVATNPAGFVSGHPSVKAVGAFDTRPSWAARLYTGNGRLGSIISSGAPRSVG